MAWKMRRCERVHISALLLILLILIRRGALFILPRKLYFKFLQHIAFLEQFKKENKLDITAVGTTQIAPMGLYSEKYKKANEIPDGSEIAIPNDPTLKKVIELYHSKEVTDAIKKETNDGSISVDLSLEELEKVVK